MENMNILGQSRIIVFLKYKLRLNNLFIIKYSETDGSNNNTLNVLKEFDLHGDDNSVTEEDIALVKEVCYLVSQRGAYIVASGRRFYLQTLYYYLKSLLF